MPRKKTPSKKEIKKKTPLFAVFLVSVNIFIIGFIILKSLDIFISSPFFAGKMRALTIGEQNEHRDAMMGIITKIAEDADVLKNDFENLKERKIMDIRDKEDIYQNIDDLEKESESLSVAYVQYATDISIDINPYKDQEIEDFMTHSKDLKVKTERLARYMENFIYSEKQPTDDQVSLMEKTFTNAYWEIDRLKGE